MSENKMKPGRIGQSAIDAYKEVEDKFTDAFLEKDPTGENLPTLKVGKLGQAAIDTYQKIEDVVVGTYQKIEDTVVGTYQKIEDTVVGEYKRVESGFVNTFLTQEKPEEKEAAAGSDTTDEAGSETTTEPADKANSTRCV